MKLRFLATTLAFAAVATALASPLKGLKVADNTGRDSRGAGTAIGALLGGLIGSGF